MTVADGFAFTLGALAAAGSVSLVVTILFVIIVLVWSGK